MIAKASIGITDSRRTSSVPASPPIFVQSGIISPAGNANSHSVSFSSSVTAGNLIIVAVSTFTAAGSGEVANGGVTDSLGNTYTRIVNVQGVTQTNAWLSIHIAQNIIGGACTVTANAIGSSAQHTIAIHEYENASIVDASGIQRNALSSSPSTPSVNTTSINELIFVAMTYAGSGTTISVPSTGYSQRVEAEDGTLLMPINTADKSVSATGSQIATWTLGAARESLCGIIAIKNAGGAPTPDTTPPSAFTLSSPSQTSSTISLSWTTATDNVGIAGYDIYVDTVFHSTTTSTSAVLSGLPPSTVHLIFVRARDAAGNFTESNTIGPSTTADSTGDEIFRITSTGDGWDYKDPSLGWTAMTLYGGTGILNATTNGITYKGYIFTNTGATNGGHPVQVSGDSVIFEYCIFKTSRNVGIRGNGANSLIVRNCLFFDLGIGAWISFSTNVKILECQFLNMKYVRAVPAAGSARSGQSVFTEAISGTGNDVSDNRIESNFGEAYNEDHINTYASEGTSSTLAYFLRRNLIRGGSGSFTGGGMIIGDAGSDFIIMDNNRLVSPGWYGFQIYGGNNCQLINNYLWSDFTLPTQLPWNRVGFLIYNGVGTCTGMTLNTTNVARYRKGSHATTGFDGTIYNIEDGCSYSSCCSPGGFSVTQSTTLTTANMPMPDSSTGFPNHLINYVSVDDYWKIRSNTFLDSELVNSHTTSVGSQNAPDVNSRRPTASVSGGPTINIVTTSTTLTSTASIATGGVGTFTLSAHSWTQTSGPNIAHIASPTDSSTSVTGMVHGTYIFRYVVEQNNSIYNLKTYQAYWVTVNVNLA